MVELLTPVTWANLTAAPTGTFKTTFGGIPPSHEKADKEVKELITALARVRNISFTEAVDLALTLMLISGGIGVAMKLTTVGKAWVGGARATGAVAEAFAGQFGAGGAKTVASRLTIGSLGKLAVGSLALGGAAITAIGTGTFSNFIGEEAIQLAGFAVNNMIIAGDVQGAKEALVEYRTIIDAGQAWLGSVGALGYIFRKPYESNLRAANSLYKSYAARLAAMEKKQLALVGKEATAAKLEFKKDLEAQIQASLDAGNVSNAMAVVSSFPDAEWQVRMNGKIDKWRSKMQIAMNNAEAARKKAEEKEKEAAKKAELKAIEKKAKADAKLKKQVSWVRLMPEGFNLTPSYALSMESKGYFTKDPTTGRFVYIPHGLTLEEARKNPALEKLTYDAMMKERAEFDSLIQRAQEVGMLYAGGIKRKLQEKPFVEVKDEELLAPVREELVRLARNLGGAQFNAWLMSRSWDEYGGADVLETALKQLGLDYRGG